MSIKAKGVNNLSLFSPGVLRLSLAWLVVIYHTASLKLGTFAVYVFFTLSGYWISVMWNTKYRRCNYSYLVFIISRYWRLLPLFLVCSVIAAWSYHVSPESWDPYPPGAFSSLYWWVRTLLIAGCSRQPLLLGPAWSLDVEMKFYFIAPLVVAGGIFSGRLSRKNQTILMFLGLFVLFLVWGLFAVKTAKYFGFFVAGMIAYVTGWRPSRALAIATVCLLVFIVCISAFFPSLSPIFWHNADMPLALPLHDWIYCFLALGFLPFAIHTVHQRSNPFDRDLGDLAYSTYIFHWIPVKIASHALLIFPYSTQITIWLVTLAGSICLYRFVDMPIDGLRRAFVKSRLVRDADGLSLKGVSHTQAPEKV